MSNKKFRNSVFAQTMVLIAIISFGLFGIFCVPTLRLSVIQTESTMVGSFTVGDFIQIFSLVTGSSSLAGFIFLQIKTKG